MPVELVVPSVGESITQVEIGDWLKTPGEAVSQDEPVVVIETNKVTVELPAPTNGTITKMLKKKDEKATVEDVIGYMKSNNAKSEAKRKKPQDSKHESKKQKPQDAKHEPDRAKPQEMKREPDWGK